MKVISGDNTVETYYEISTKGIANKKNNIKELNVKNCGSRIINI